MAAILMSRSVMNSVTLSSLLFKPFALNRMILKRAVALLLELFSVLRTFALNSLGWLKVLGWLKLFGWLNRNFALLCFADVWFAGGYLVFVAPDAFVTEKVAVQFLGC